MASFVPNPHIYQEVGGSEDMASFLKEQAEAVARTAKAIAPYDPNDDEHYRDEVDVEMRLSKRGIHWVRVVAKKFTSRFIEFGTIDTPAFAPLRRAAERQGLHLR